MMFSPRQLRGSTSRVAVILLIGGAGACSEPLNPPVADSLLQEMQADNVIFGMASYMTASGVREGRVEADTAFMYADSAVALLRQMEIVFYDGEGREVATVTGLRGRWSHETDEMVARGNVVLVVSADSSRLESAEIHYDPNNDRIWSDSTTVRTEADGSVTTGTAFTSNITFDSIRIENPRGGGRRVF